MKLKDPELGRVSRDEAPLLAGHGDLLPVYLKGKCFVNSPKEAIDRTVTLFSPDRKRVRHCWVICVLKLSTGPDPVPDLRIDFSCWLFKLSCQKNLITIMKKFIIPSLIAVTASTLLTGCLALQLGGGTTTKIQSETTGQQLLDLKRAKDAGALTDAEYETQKQKILNGK